MTEHNTSAQVFVPFKNRKPASIEVNGHRLLVLSPERESVEESLEMLGADRVKRVELGESEEEQERAMIELSKRAGASIVMAPPEVDIDDVIKSLQMQLPYVH